MTFGPTSRRGSMSRKDRLHCSLFPTLNSCTCLMHCRLALLPSTTNYYILLLLLLLLLLRYTTVTMLQWTAQGNKRVVMTKEHVERELEKEIWSVGFRKYSWRKMAEAAQDRAGWSREVAYIPLVATSH